MYSQVYIGMSHLEPMGDLSKIVFAIVRMYAVPSLVQELPQSLSQAQCDDISSKPSYIPKRRLMSEVACRLAHMQETPDGLSPAASGGWPRHRRQASAASEQSSVFPASHAGSVAGQATAATSEAPASIPPSSPQPSPRQSHAGDLPMPSLLRPSPTAPAGPVANSGATSSAAHVAEHAQPEPSSEAKLLDSGAGSQAESSAAAAGSPGEAAASIAAADSAAGGATR